MKETAEIASRLACDRLETGETGISLVVEGSLDLNQDGSLVSNSPIQIVDSQEYLAKTKEEIDELYQEAGQDTGEGLRIGPLLSEGEIQSRIFSPSLWIAKQIVASLEAVRNRIALFPLVPKAQAQGPGPIVNIGGKIEVETPPPGVKVLVLFHFPKASAFNIQNFELIGPDGRAGESDAEESCDAKGADGGDAFRFFARASNITVNNFILRLGYGGRGGDVLIALAGNVGRTGTAMDLGGDGGNVKTNGGNGCYEGFGGEGGNGNPSGQDGSKGENVCKLPEKEPKVTPETEPGPDGQGLSFTCGATAETVEGFAMNYLTVKVAGNTYRFPEFTCADSQNYKVAWCDKVESIPADRAHAEDYVINLFYENSVPCEPLAGYEASCDQMKGASGIIYGNCSYLSTAP